MPVSLVASVLTQAGIRLIDTLIHLSREAAEATGAPEFAILEHWLLAVHDTNALMAAFNEAQIRFGSYASAHERWLEVFEELLRHAGEKRQRLAEDLWSAYLFRSQNATETLWDQYPDIQRLVISETGNYLPRSWGEWVLPMQTFMGIAEQCLVEQNSVFENLFGSEELLALVEELSLQENDRGLIGEPGDGLSPDLQPDQAVLTGYLTACKEQIGHIDPRGYPRSIHTTVPLSDVFVPPRIVPLDARVQPVDYMRYQTASYDDPEIHVFREPLGHHELEAHQGVGIRAILAQYQHILILGEAGAGKTTLLRSLLLEYAESLLDDKGSTIQVENARDGPVSYRLATPLPIYVDLADYVEYHHFGETLGEFILRMAADIAQDESVSNLIALLLESGQCLLLLDGLDQAATDEQRRMLVAAVIDLVNEVQTAGNQIVITSRFEGYDISPLPPEFAGFLIQPLDRGQINSFLLRWRLTLARMQRPLIGDDQALRRAQTETLALYRQITANPRLCALVNTPLLLRMLVGVYHSGMVLIPQRAAIYQLVAEALIREWRLSQSGAHRSAVMEHEAVALLGELAYWLHSSRANGQLSERELREILGHIWGGMHPEATPEQVQQAIGDFLGTLRLHSGVLVELAPQRYGFAHQGLQEYFAARYMVSSFRRAAQRIREHLHDPRWSEVIALAVGFTSLRSQDDASDLIETAILARGARAVQFGHASSPFESLLKRDLFFAARLLVSGVEARPELTRLVVRQLMQLWLEGERDCPGRFHLIFDTAGRYLMNLDGTSASRVALQVAIDHLSAPDEHVQAYAVDALTFWPTHMAEAQEALVGLGTQAPPLVKRAIASALGRMSGLSLKAYVHLLALTADVDEQVCALARRSLERAGPVPYEAMRMWVSFLHSDDPVKRRVSLRRLQQIGSLPPVVVGELLRLLDDPDRTIRQRAVETLASVSDLPDDALTAIYRVIADADPMFRATAINAFAREVELPAQVVQQLVRWSDDPDASVRLAALTALGKCLNASPDVVDALIERLYDAADSIRAAAAEPFVIKARDHPYALHMLSHIASDPIYQVRCAIASALRHIPAPDGELQDVLNTLLSDRETLVRETTLDTIRQLAEPGPDIIDHLISLATMPEHPIRRKAVQALASLKNLPDRALLALLQALQVYDEALGREIVACLRAHTPLSMTVLNHVMDLAVLPDTGTEHTRQSSANLRALALEVLGYSLLDDASVALQILLEAASQPNSIPVKVAALRGLAYARVMSPSVMNTLGMALKNGPLPVRSAAGIALAHLIRRLPDPPLEGEQLLEVARTLADILMELPAKSAWEPESRTQNEVLQALSWVVARGRPTLPRLGERSEDTARYLNQ